MASRMPVSCSRNLPLRRSVTPATTDDNRVVARTGAMKGAFDDGVVTRAGPVNGRALDDWVMA